MRSNFVNGVVAVVAIAGVVILVLRDANPNTLVLAVIMIANALGIGYNNTRTETVAKSTAAVAANTNGVLHTLAETVQTHDEELIAIKEENGKS
jgi:uncharacterized membrane protein